MALIIILRPIRAHTHAEKSFSTNELLEDKTHEQEGWAQEHRLKQSEVIRNWKPWEKSTGAKTSQGKEKSKMNAFKHGVRSSALLYLKAIIDEYADRLGNFMFVVCPR